MSDTSTDTVTLNLDGTFEAKAASGAAAGDALAEALDKLTAASARVKDPKAFEAAKIRAAVTEMDALAAIQAKIAAFDGPRTRALAQQEALLKRMRDNATGIADAERNKGLAASAKANDESSWSSMGAAAGGVAAAGMIILHAAEKLASAAFDLTKAGVALSIAQTSKREVQGGALGTLGGNYEQTVKMALKMGIDVDDAVTQTKKLLNAGFKNTEVPALIRIKAGMDVAGLDGDALLKKLETIKLGSKVGTKDVEGLKKLGVDVNEVYKKIAADTGKSMDAVKAAVKAGTQDATSVVSAIESVAGGKFGKLADQIANSVPALANRVKGDLLEMFAFEPSTLDPIRNALKTVATVLEGPDGAKLKASLSEIFVEVSGLFKGITAGDVKAVIKEVAADAHKMAAALHMAAPAIKDFASGMATVSLGALGLIADAMTGAAYWARELDRAIKDPIGALEDLGMAAGEAAFDVLNALGDGLDAAEAAVIAWGVSVIADAYDTAASWLEAGINMAMGLADGIEAGASAAIDAAIKMATDALNAAKDALRSHSPSEAFGDLGDDSATGLAQNMEKHPGPEAAGKKMANNALGAAKGEVAGKAGAAGAAAGAAGAGGGGGSVTYQITMGAGTTEADLARLEALLRKVDRARAEGGMMPAYG